MHAAILLTTINYVLLAVRSYTTTKNFQYL